MDADELAPCEEVPVAGLEVGLADALARAAGLLGATVGEDAALATVGGADEAALVAAGTLVPGVAAKGAVAADEAAGVADPVSTGRAEWLVAVQAAVISTGTATRAAIARRRCRRWGGGVTGTGVILADRPPV